MSLGKLKLLTILLPPLLIGGFEFIRHDFLLEHLSMEAGNVYITLLTLLLSYIFAAWMFRRIERINRSLAAEQSRRAVYEERERLAQELHDNIAQILFFLNVQLKKGQLQEARAAVSEIDEQLRQAIFNLRTAPEDGATFAARLHAWLEQWSRITGIAVEQSIEMPQDGVPPSTEVRLFAIIREAFTNIRKHSQADHATIEFSGAGEGKVWRLVIRDNGAGIAETAWGRENRYGVALMRKHAEELRAELTIRTHDQGGTEVLVSNIEARR
ncbi:sensor histidine kinase [Paenibacillus xerothermodurans]|uniref:histidine kinase n=1 Tax=Paenibacillus xerothermodurans TaxID=1977292 RepID=A0A2W1NKK3_PAEXE|nr:histidine kinase [Paenibacillus xerothermodurans]PZE19925.1 sensor histidine kinase [Paenibacillus xerothermodurans]